MNYEEELIDGVLCRREVPDGVFEQYRLDTLTNLLIYERERTRLLTSQLLNIRSKGVANHE